MQLEYAVREYKRAREERKQAKRKEEKYKREILNQCPENTTVYNLGVTWYLGSKIDTEKMKLDGIDVEGYRVATKWTARLTILE